VFRFDHGKDVAGVKLKKRENVERYLWSVLLKIGWKVG